MFIQDCGRNEETEMELERRHHEGEGTVGKKG